MNVANTAVASVAEVAVVPRPSSELFALSDEQILEIEPEVALPDPASQSLPLVPSVEATETVAAQVPTESAQPTASVALEPPRWLADMMADPQAGAEARDLWNGVETARQEAAAYRDVFAKPEEARVAAERARALEEIDAAFFGGVGKSAQDISAGRAALADRMLREDPAAFREMVFAGLRALEAAGQNSFGASSQEHVAAVLRPRPVAAQAAAPLAAAKKPPSEEEVYRVDSPALSAYRSFEKSANEELERSVGGAIQRSLEQALPNLSRVDRSAGGAQGASLQTRLQHAVRDDVESALKSDQQLGEQLGRVLAAGRFDETTRAQVVRLINDRAQQLVPVAARRVIQEWTQTAFAALEASNDANAASPRSLANSFGAATQPRFTGSAESGPSASRASAPSTSSKVAAANRAERDAGLTPRTTARANGRAVDYNRLSDEQILDL